MMLLPSEDSGAAELSESLFFPCGGTKSILFIYFLPFFAPLPSENTHCSESNVQINAMFSTILPKATIKLIIRFFFILIFSVQLYFEAQRNCVSNASTNSLLSVRPNSRVK